MRSEKMMKKGEKIEKSERIKQVKLKMSKIAKKVSVKEIFGLNYFYFKLLNNKLY
jgi:hypothetical protein